METYTPVKDIFDHLRSVIPSERFLNREGLGNEVPFFICPYNPADTVRMEDAYKSLISQLEQAGKNIYQINLYDLMVEILIQRNIWGKTLQLETGISKPQLHEMLSNVLDAERHLIPAIAERVSAQDIDVLFLSGVGEVFPYIRSHTILNNLQKTAKDYPTVMFFPGKYTQSISDGASLDLFGILRGDKYYRAFNILNYRI